jgi:preprotein translocase SecE subunit
MAIVKTTPKTVGNTGSANRAAENQAVTKGGARPYARAPRSESKASGAFISETTAELKKVVWPSKEDIRAGTIVTVLLLIVFGAYISGLDWAFESLFKSLDVYGDSATSRG